MNSPGFGGIDFYVELCWGRSPGRGLAPYCKRRAAVVDNVAEIPVLMASRRMVYCALPLLSPGRMQGLAREFGINNETRIRDIAATSDWDADSQGRPADSAQYSASERRPDRRRDLGCRRWPVLCCRLARPRSTWFSATSDRKMWAGFFAASPAEFAREGGASGTRATGSADAESWFPWKQQLLTPSSRAAERAGSGVWSPIQVWSTWCAPSHNGVFISSIFERVRLAGLQRGKCARSGSEGGAEDCGGLRSRGGGKAPPVSPRDT